MQAIKIEGLTKRYGRIVAVDGLSLCVEEGELLSLLGVNGAGKTTTLKACIGILGFEEGEILINGISVKDDPMAAKRICAYIPDDPALYGYLTGIKYLNFVADVFGVGADERDVKIHALADKFSITANLGEKIGAYSHGMKQKLAIIAAWLHSPKLIIMDEPFVGLDPVASHTLKEMMREHCDSGGSIFFSTHVLDVAEKICDKVAIIKEGRLVVMGNMKEVRGDASLESVFLELSEEDK